MKYLFLLALLVGCSYNSHIDNKVSLNSHDVSKEFASDMYHEIDETLPLYQDNVESILYNQDFVLAVHSFEFSVGAGVTKITLAAQEDSILLPTGREYYPVVFDYKDCVQEHKDFIMERQQDTPKSVIVVYELHCIPYDFWKKLKGDDITNIEKDKTEMKNTIEKCSDYAKNSIFVCVNP